MNQGGHRAVSTPEVSAVIVSHNSRAHLADCLASLERDILDFGLEVIVVDNSSSDGSPELIRERFPLVRLIRNARNVGFSRANNQGIRETRGPLVLLLNPDSAVLPSSLTGLVGEMRSHPQTGAVGPALVRGQGRFQVSFGNRVSFFPQLLQKSVLNAYYKIRLKKDRRRRRVGWLSGACLLCRRTAVEEAGFFDERFFLYFEDIDLCLRMRNNGWDLVYLPQARVSHEGGASTGRQRASSRFFYRESQLYFYQKHNSRASLILLRLYLGLVFSLQRVWGVLRRKRDSAKAKEPSQLLKKR